MTTGSAAAPLPDGAARVAVVIEDDADIRHLLQAILEQAGFTTHAAETGDEGIEAIQEHQPILTTLDISLPGIDGFEVARRIRSFSTTYIIMLSARATW
jgi:DNA-binding response OmpR family regulator